MATRVAEKCTCRRITKFIIKIILNVCVHLLVSSSYQSSLMNGHGLFKESLFAVMLPDFSDTRINVAQIGFCWQLTGLAVASQTLWYFN